MTTDDEVPREKELHSDVLGHIDGSGSTVEPLMGALHAADEDGLYVESDEDRAADIGARLDRAMEEVDQNDPDPEDVLDEVHGAAAAASEFRRGLSNDASEYEIPEHVDAGVYETLGEYAEYVERDIIRIREKAAEWVEEAA